MEIDNGNHLLLSGNHAALDYLRRIGAERSSGAGSRRIRFCRSESGSAGGFGQ